MSNKRIVLLIEDEKDIRSLVVRLLKSMNVDVITSSNASEGLHILKEYASDIKLIILDLLTPVLTGWEALPIIRKSYPDINVLISTAFADVSEIGHFLYPGKVELLNKPYTIGEFRKLVTRMIQ